MFRKGTKNEVPRTLSSSTSRALTNRPTADLKTKANSTVSSSSGLRTKSVLKSSVNTGSRLNKTESAAVAKSKPVIKRKLPLKDQVEQNEKKSKEFKAKIKELTETSQEAQKKLQEIDLSAAKQRHDESKKCFEEQQKIFEETNKRFEALLQQTQALQSKLEETDKKKDETEKKTEENNLKIEELSKKVWKKSSHFDTLTQKNKIVEEKIQTRTEERREYRKYMDEVFEDLKNLHNDVFLLKGHCQVVCKIRPKMAEEKVFSIVYNDENSISIAKSNVSMPLTNSKSKSFRKDFSFNRIFPPSTSVDQIFEEVLTFVDSGLEGKTTCIFMCDPEKKILERNEENGLLKLIADYIYGKFENLNLIGWDFKISLKCVEISEEVPKTEMTKKDISSSEELMSSYLEGKNKLDSSILLQIQINGENSCLSKSLSGVINIMETSLEKDSFPKLREIILSTAQNEKPKKSPLLDLLSVVEEPTTILTILMVSPCEQDYSKSLDLMRFGNEIILSKSRPKKATTCLSFKSN